MGLFGGKVMIFFHKHQTFLLLFNSKPFIYILNSQEIATSDSSFYETKAPISCFIRNFAT